LIITAGKGLVTASIRKWLKIAVVIRGILLLVATASSQAQSGIYAYFNNDPKIKLGSYLSDFEMYVITQNSVAGITVVVPWFKYDTGSSTSGPILDTSLGTGLGLLDNHMQTVAGSSKKINLIIWAGTDAEPNTSTPPYVFTIGATGWPTTCSLSFGCTTTTPVDTCDCHNYHGSNFTGPGSVGSNCTNQSGGTVPFDGGGVPATWEQPLTIAYENWLNQLLFYYRPSGSSVIRNQIGYIRIGVGTGGGSVVACPNVEMNAFLGQTSAPAIVLSEGIWKSYNNEIYSYVQSTAQSYGLSAVVLEASPFGGVSLGMNDGTIPISWADDVAQVAIENGFGIGAESLSGTTDQGDLLLYSVGQPCSNDWCSLFNSYSSVAPMQSLQTLSQSKPSCLNQSSTCNITGSLVTVLPFATQHQGTTFEIYYEDLLCAYDQNPYSDSDCTVPTPYTPYESALTNAAAGQPSGTSNLVGASNLSGPAAIQ
jgi:hypothetical protein